LLGFVICTMKLRRFFRSCWVLKNRNRKVKEPEWDRAGKDRRGTHLCIMHGTWIHPTNKERTVIAVKKKSSSPKGERRNKSNQ
jgi:hypothetical protein